MGNVGTGKSTLVEKVTGKSRMSSAASRTFTNTCELYRSVDDSFIICDTPGINSFSDQHNLNSGIAEALSFMPVSLVVITVQACPRIESVLKSTSEFIECLDPNSFPMEVIRFCITHMDKVEWRIEELMKRSHFGSENTLWSSSKKQNKTLLQEIETECSKIQPVLIQVDSIFFQKLYNCGHDQNDRNYGDGEKDPLVNSNSIKGKSFSCLRNFLCCIRVNAKINHATEDIDHYKYSYPPQKYECCESSKKDTKSKKQKNHNLGQDQNNIADCENCHVYNEKEDLLRRTKAEPISFRKKKQKRSSKAAVRNSSNFTASTFTSNKDFKPLLKNDHCVSNF